MRPCFSQALLIAAVASLALTGGASAQIPKGCTSNSLQLALSRPQAAVCVGETIPYTVFVNNPVFPACQATELTVRFWAPNNPPNALPDICNSTNPTITLATGLTLNPGESMTFLPQDFAALNFLATTPGAVTAWACVTGLSQTTEPPDNIVDGRDITTTVIGFSCEISGGADAVCPGQTTEWCAPEGAFGTTYSWTGPGGLASTNRCITVGTPGQYCVTVTDGETGCSAQCCRTLGSTPGPPCTITEGSDEVCQGFETTWCGPLGDGLTYGWTGPGEFSASSQCITIGAAGEYCLTVTAADGCESTCCRTLRERPCDLIECIKALCGLGTATAVPLTVLGLGLMRRRLR